MATAIALVSVISSASVAVCVPFLTARLESTRAAAQLRTNRLDELRSVADTASLALATAEEALMDAELAVESACKRAADTSHQAAAESTIEVARACVKAVHQALHRTAVRLGWSSPISQLYSDALRDLRAELKTIEDVYRGGPSSDNPAAWEEVTAALHEVRAEYEIHRAAFYESAGRLVGPEGPTTR